MYALTEDVIDDGALRDHVAMGEHGAVLVFHGITRNHFDGRGVVRLEYEAYGPMAVAEMATIGAEAEERWPGVKVAVVHRTGVVPLGEASVVIAVGAPHRGECYDASRFVIDTLKERVPIWKKEIYADGSAWKANAPTRGG
jgi:molybdopterin synthase catalytic subunit